MNFGERGTGEGTEAIRTLYATDPRTVSPGSADDLDGKNFDVRGFAQVTIEVVDASSFDYSWVASGEATAHGFGDDGTAGGTNATATTTKLDVAGSFLRVDPTGGDVRVHLIP